MKTLITICSFISLSAFAGTFSAVGFESLVDERAEVNVYKTKSPKTAVQDSIRSGIKRHSISSCGKAVVVVSRREALKSLEGFYSEFKIASKLYDLHKRNKIASAVIVTDGEDGESEYCSQSTIEFHSVDGETLSLFFDYNT